MMQQYRLLEMADGHSLHPHYWDGEFEPDWALAHAAASEAISLLRNSEFIRRAVDDGRDVRTPLDVSSTSFCLMRIGLGPGDGELLLEFDPEDWQ